MQKPTHPTTKSVKQVYNQIAQEFDQTRQKPWPEFEDFKKWIPQKGSVLDVGCGNGRLSEWLGEDIEYLGVDQSEAFIQIAQKNHPNRKFEVAEMSQLDLKKEFDAIISIAAFHHLPDKENRKETLKRFHSHLKPEGVLIMTVWNLWQKKYSKE